MIFIAVVIEKMSEVFKSFDADGSGLLEEDELILALQQLYPGKTFTPEYCQNILAKFGTSHGGEALTEEEFLAAIEYVKTALP